eukprot:CAMPEP_0175039284 /NCGR_PEP_ID=MMETSP0052_2-20121109/470_1 /TAXON_ID=51329 ORGANISM="Polytomella parva, Strain SAG 63-3" /NCGR_SAMPLE_ID=MMETSP0052_2 /ASSEMBLY_ACC=CAM_ASM_000194 /LENGTH=763 /DNA_ID=CAMNT_0016301063 /DNA_START=235 /DNA_END=2524 /DNA_ORIENTATION=+
MKATGSPNTFISLDTVVSDKNSNDCSYHPHLPNGNDDLNHTNMTNTWLNRFRPWQSKRRKDEARGFGNGQTGTQSTHYNAIYGGDYTSKRRYNQNGIRYDPEFDRPKESWSMLTDSNPNPDITSKSGRLFATGSTTPPDAVASPWTTTSGGEPTTIKQRQLIFNLDPPSYSRKYDFIVRHLEVPSSMVDDYVLYSHEARTGEPRNSLLMVPTSSPYHPLALIWWGLMLIFDLTFTAFWIPTNVAFCTQNYGDLRESCVRSDFAAGIIYLIHWLLCFQVGMVISSGRKRVVLRDGRAIAFFYMRSMRFVVDTISLAPFFYLLCLISSSGSYKDHQKLVSLISIIRLSRLFRIVSIIRSWYTDIHLTSSRMNNASSGHNPSIHPGSNHPSGNTLHRNRSNRDSPSSLAEASNIGVDPSKLMTSNNTTSTSYYYGTAVQSHHHHNPNQHGLQSYHLSKSDSHGHQLNSSSHPSYLPLSTPSGVSNVISNTDAEASRVEEGGGVGGWISKRLSVVSATALLFIFQLLIMTNLFASIMVALAFFYDYKTTPTWVNSLWWENLTNASQPLLWYNAIYWVITVESTVGAGQAPRQIGEQIMANFIMLYGMLFNGFVVGLVSQALLRARGDAWQKYLSRKKLAAFAAWAALRNLPKTVAQEIQIFLAETTLNKSDLNFEAELVEELPPSLRRKVTHALAFPLLAHVRPFHGAHVELISHLAQRMRPVELPEGHNLCRQGEEATALWVVEEGSVVALRHGEAPAYPVSVPTG